MRIYNLLVHGPLYERIPVHPNVLPICERVLDPGLLVSSLSSIAIGPGEPAQPIHADDQVIPLPKPHPPTVCNTMWALTDFTEANGATRVIPGTHRAAVVARPLPTPTTPSRRRCPGAVCSSGTAACGTAAGPTPPTDRRVGIAMNYCAGYLRQQENQQLGSPPRRPAVPAPPAGPRRLRDLQRAHRAHRQGRALTCRTGRRPGHVHAVGLRQAPTGVTRPPVRRVRTAAPARTPSRPRRPRPIATHTATRAHLLVPIHRATARSRGVISAASSGSRTGSRPPAPGAVTAVRRLSGRPLRVPSAPMPPLLQDRASFRRSRGGPPATPGSPRLPAMSAVRATPPSEYAAANRSTRKRL